MEQQNTDPVDSFLEGFLDGLSWEGRRNHLACRRALGLMSPEELARRRRMMAGEPTQSPTEPTKEQS